MISQTQSFSALLLGTMYDGRETIFVAGLRSTDDGVTGAATDSMFINLNLSTIHRKLTPIGTRLWMIKETRVLGFCMTKMSGLVSPFN